MTAEEDAQYAEGYITSITEVPLSPRYSIQHSSETYRASLVELDGKTFYFLSAKGLKVGQEIAISFLPKCDMVLTCQVVQN